MKIDITQLLSIFDELINLTNEEEGAYWFKTTRNDGLVVSLALSVYESKVAISVCNIEEATIISLRLNGCLEIAVLDENRKCLEVLHKSGRCFVSLLGNPILEYTD